MDLTEALTELGLDSGTPHDEASVRRAYLKGVKVRKPETDPDGFRRLREAYELLRMFGPALPIEPARPADAAATRPADDAEGANYEAHDGDEAGDETEEWVSEDALQPFWDRFSAEPGENWRERLEIAREAYRAFPGHPGAAHMLTEAITNGHARTDHLIALLRAGAEQGDPGASWALLTHHPEDVPAEELARLRREGSPSERLDAARAYLQQNQGEQALSLLEEVLQPGGDRADPYLTRQALRFVLYLHRRDLVPLAQRAFAAVTAYQGGTMAPRAGEVSPQMALLQVLCRELDEMPDLPLPFRQDVARAVLEDDFGVMAYTVRAYERTHGPRRTLRLRKQVRARAPTLASLLHWNHEARLSWRILVPSGSFIGFLILMSLIRCIGREVTTRTPSPGAGIVTVSGPRPGEMPMQAYCSWNLEQQQRVDLAPDIKRRLAAAAARFCPNVKLLEQAMRDNDCLTARARLGGLQLEARGGSKRVHLEVEKLTAEVNGLCSH